MYRKIINKLLIIGCGGHAKVVTDIAKSCGISDFYYQDSNLKHNKFLGVDVFHDEINNYKGYFFVAIGNNFLREKITLNFLKKNPNSINKTLIHPSSIISDNCSIGDGVVIMPLCVVNSCSRIGNGVIINTKSSLDHDNFLRDFSSIAPGVTTGGNVEIGSKSAISIGAVVRNNIKIGSNSIIGAASFVNNDMPDNCIAYGTPAKIIK